MINKINYGDAGWQGDAGAFRHAKKSLRSLLISENIWIKKWTYDEKYGLHLDFPKYSSPLNLPDDLKPVEFDTYMQMPQKSFNISETKSNGIGKKRRN
jgi:hypothetical protein